MLHTAVAMTIVHFLWIFECVIIAPIINRIIGQQLTNSKPKKNTINKEIKNKSDVKKPKRTPVLCFYFHSNGEKKEDKQIIKSHLFGHLWLNCFVLHTFCAIEIVNSISSTNILKRYEKNSYDFITAEIA